jgi:hypothetical protein
LFGFEPQGFLDAWAPVFFFAMISAIAMDYTVFLLASAKEHFEDSGDPKDAMVGSFAHSGRVIFRRRRCHGGGVLHLRPPVRCHPRRRGSCSGSPSSLTRSWCAWCCCPSCSASRAGRLVELRMADAAGAIRFSHD